VARERWDSENGDGLFSLHCRYFANHQAEPVYVINRLIASGGTIGYRIPTVGKPRAYSACIVAIALIIRLSSRGVAWIERGRLATVRSVSTIPPHVGKPAGLLIYSACIVAFSLSTSLGYSNWPANETSQIHSLLRSTFFCRTSNLSQSSFSATPYHLSIILLYFFCLSLPDYQFVLIFPNRTYDLQNEPPANSK